jgi:hypothetical protein
MEQVGWLVKGKDTFVCLYTVKGERGRRGMALLILNLYTGWSGVVNFPSRPFDLP